MAERTFIIPTREGFPAQVSPVITDTSSGGLALTSGTLAALAIPLLLLGLIPSMMPSLMTPTTTCPAWPGCTTPGMTPTTPCPACPGCTTPVPCSPTPACPTGFMKLTFGGLEVDNNKCYLFSKTPKAFFQHLVGCNELGGNLLNIESVIEANAVIEYLNNNDPGAEYYIGYTDFVAADPVVSIAGGPLPIPILGSPPDTGARNCITMKIVNNVNAFQTYDCKLTQTENGICEVDLNDQMCVCP